MVVDVDFIHTGLPCLQQWSLPPSLLPPLGPHHHPPADASSPRPSRALFPYKWAVLFDWPWRRKNVEASLAVGKSFQPGKRLTLSHLFSKRSATLPLAAAVAVGVTGHSLLIAETTTQDFFFIDLVRFGLKITCFGLFWSVLSFDTFVPETWLHVNCYMFGKRGTLLVFPYM